VDDDQAALDVDPPERREADKFAARLAEAELRRCADHAVRTYREQHEVISKRLHG
jgi:hypothetical protein